MNKSTIIIIVLIIAILIVALAFLFPRNSGSDIGSNGTGSTGTLPPVATATFSPPVGNSFIIGTNQGGVVVKNFYNSPAYVTTDKQTVVLVENETYTIVYNTSDSSFIISLLSLPLSAARTAAENGFLQQLGISEQDACKLTVNEGVPIDVSNQYPGENLGMSFCPGAVAL